MIDLGHFAVLTGADISRAAEFVRPKRTIYGYGFTWRWVFVGVFVGKPLAAPQPPHAPGADQEPAGATDG